MAGIFDATAHPYAATSGWRKGNVAKLTKGKLENGIRGTACPGL